MGIVEVTGSVTPLDPLKGTKGESTQKSKAAPKHDEDRVDLSEEARALYDAGQAKRFEAIREKIREGFYFQPDVTEKIVDALLKELRTPPSE